ncbi:iron ABC transporter substrate-binding protein [Acidocella aminolytica]|uniref:ABC transporter Fe3+ permease n=1 Tax=Acidocella aminolytica 101 = DSM 11237 TaxID=1120923 RepID=A0A0D6PCX4_9PROT|nr:iron ABC transporter substrate-binding protein [Acidocella aminolytica]GAN79527.1 ABC transporter Fe3+ permease [Acidocella aminolytica 101 = DSM 11237]GBQ32658.1 Fe3+ ABC transporter substrate-binding periplasmic protein [Acidocella aminolytica 101 = DSM 11237]SHF34437.1 iron(III) transport system substrate-binding protein [Acidocella aminolytica 101 = DSM 11237]
MSLLEHRWSRSNFAGLGVAALAACGLLACTPHPAVAATLVLYSGQHEQTVNMLVSAFEKKTGIGVKVHSGDGPEVAAQIIQEGTASPADVFFTENSPEIAMLAEKGLLAKVDPSTLAEIPSKYNAPDGTWVGVLARENVLAYNPSMIAASALPASLMDLAKPKWKGKIAIAPSDNDFLPLVNAVVVTHGKAAALAWLKGLKANAKIYDDDEGVVAAVNRGAVATGIINNYYWARLQQELGKAKTHSDIYHFSHGDVGGLINISGAGVLKTSKDPKDAQRFLAFLVSAPAQKMLADTPVTFEYPLRPGIAPNPVLKPFNELQPPAISVSQLGDDASVVTLLHEAGLL